MPSDTGGSFFGATVFDGNLRPCLPMFNRLSQTAQPSQHLRIQMFFCTPTVQQCRLYLHTLKLRAYYSCTIPNLFSALAAFDRSPNDHILNKSQHQTKPTRLIRADPAKNPRRVLSTIALIFVCYIIALFNVFVPLNYQVSSFDIAVVGIPFDSGCTYRPGARFGPESIRSASRLIRR